MRMGTISTGLDGRPRPDFLASHRPVLVVLAAPLVTEVMPSQDHASPVRVNLP